MDIQFETVTPEELNINEIQAREKIGDVKGLAASIEAQGLHNPIQVWVTTDAETGADKKVLLAGHRRLAAIQLLIDEGRANGLAEGIPARLIHAETEVQARQIALTNNIEAEALTTFEIAQEVHRLKNLGESQKSIAKGINRSETWVSRKLNTFEKAGKELRKAWKSGKLPDDTVEDLATLDEEEQDKAVAEQLADRAGGTRDDKSKARQKGKDKAGKPTKLGAKVVQEIVLTVQESSQSKSDYIRGVYDALRLTQGSIPLGKMDSEFKVFLKEEERIAKERAAAEAAAAKEKLNKDKASKAKKSKAKKDEDEDEDDDE